MSKSFKSEKFNQEIASNESSYESEEIDSPPLIGIEFSRKISKPSPGSSQKRKTESPGTFKSSLFLTDHVKVKNSLATFTKAGSPLSLNPNTPKNAQPEKIESDPLKAQPNESG